MKYFLAVLSVLFIALKLTGVIKWSWFLVLLPVLPLAIAKAFVAFVIIRHTILVYRNSKRKD